MEAEEKCCTVDRQLGGLGAKPVHWSLLRADVYEVIADEEEDILTGACCVRGDVAELFDRFPDGLNVRHIMRVDHTARSQQSRRVASSTRWTAASESGGSGSQRSGIADVTSPVSKVWLEFDPLVYLSRYEQPARLH